MRFRVVYVVGFGVLVLLTLLLLLLQGMIARLALTALHAAVVLVLLIVLLCDREHSATHGLMTAVLFLTIVFLVIFSIGRPSLTSFFLGGVFILLYLFMLGLILVTDWRQYRMLKLLAEEERRRNAERVESQRKELAAIAPPERPPDADSVEEDSVEEPPRIRVKQDNDGEWIEIEVKKHGKEKIRTKKRLRGASKAAPESQRRSAHPKRT